MSDLADSLAVIRKPQSLKDLAHGSIKNAILTLRFQPGQALSNRDLASQLQISETPIRDALQELEQEGFVTRIPHKGTFVTEIDPKDIEETFQLRATLERLSVELTVPTLDPIAFDQMAALLNDAEKALADGEREQCSQLGYQFHQCFIRPADNRRLKVILQNLEDHHARFRRISDTLDGRLEKSQIEHRQIFEAAKAGDVEQVANAMYNHLVSVLADMSTSHHLTQKQANLPTG